MSLSSDLVLCADNASKKFSVSLRHVMKYGAIDIARNMVGLRSNTSSLRVGEFWAVDGVSFDLKKGETLGIIGANGSGKSTLLKMISGIYMPDRGSIKIRGRVGALIEVGAGFNPMLTGRENIYINGAILGMGKSEIKKKFDRIVDFADIGDFIDAPVKHYSSGMFVRLGFSVAIHSNPDLLLVDEVLAVGDANFQKKCFDKILDMKQGGTSIVFVSHSVHAIERLCTSALLIKSGKQVSIGNTRDVIQRYFHEISQDNLNKSSMAELFGIGDVTFSDVRAYPDNGDKLSSNIEFGADIIIEFYYKFLKKRSQNNQIRVGIRTHEGRDVQKIIFQEVPFLDGHIYENERFIALDDEGFIQVKILNPRLFPQTYRVDVSIVPLDKAVHLGGIANAALFNIVQPKDKDMYFEYGNMSVVEFDYQLLGDKEGGFRCLDTKGNKASHC